MLRDHVSIARHLEEYFEDVRTHLPWAVRLGLDLSTGNYVLSR
jgi:RHH-type proline utilization regulon transcriptional repressor/proline dehydrogenase/delta 1-pyrroline-5-carboxylate dehydrogenase